MKKTVFLRSFFLILVCSLSFFSYRYLQAAKANIPQPRHTQPMAQGGSIENGADSNSTNKPSEAPNEQRYEPSTLPDIELLKFVIQKSREGIPVLRFDPSWLLGN